jgi:hypothetical protein
MQTSHKVEDLAVVSGDYNEICELNLRRFALSELAFSFSITGAAVTNFKIQGKNHPDDTWFDYLVSADFADPIDSVLPSVSATGPHELSDGGVAQARVILGAMHSARLLVEPAGAATVSLYASLGGVE